MQEAGNGGGGLTLTSSQGLLNSAACHIYTLNTREGQGYCGVPSCLITRTSYFSAENAPLIDFNFA